MTTCINASERLTSDEAAAYLGVEPQTLACWRSVGRYGLVYTKVGKKVFYSRADLDAWLAARRATSTAAHVALAAAAV